MGGIRILEDRKGIGSIAYTICARKGEDLQFVYERGRIYNMCKKGGGVRICGRGGGGEGLGFA